MKFSHILKSIVQLIGGDSDEIDAPLFRFVRDAVNHRIRLWWDAAQWTSAIKTEYSENFSGNLYPILDDREVIEVYDFDPRTNSRAKEIDFQQDEEGVHFISNQNGIWIRFKLPCPQFFGDPSSDKDGGERYYDGDFRNVANEIVSVPDRAINYLIRSVYADYLRSNNQHEAAAAEESSAEGVLTIELDRLYNRKGQTPALRIKHV